MKTWILVLMLAAALLLAGCAGGSANAGANANGNAGGANAGANSQGNANAGGSDNGGANANANANVNANAGSNAVQAAGLLAMEAAGIPTQCTINVQGQPPSTVYVKGTSLRIETPISPENQTIIVTTIIKNKVAYVDAAAMQVPGLNCDWLMINASAMGNATAGAPAASAPAGAADEQSLENLPAASFNCAPAAFGDEKFATAGKVCSFGDLLGQAISGMMNGSAYGSGSGNGGSASGSASGSAGANAGDNSALVQACAQVSDPATRQAMGCPSS